MDTVYKYSHCTLLQLEGAANLFKIESKSAQNRLKNPLKNQLKNPLKSFERILKSS